MKIKIERSHKKRGLRNKKIRVVTLGKHRKMVLVLWLVLFCSISFGVYKNFTAVDQHTTHEKIIIREKVLNTSNIENFTIDFAKVYFTWKNDKKVIEQRTNTLKQYLTDEEIELSQSMVRPDIPTSSEVKSVQILDVEKRIDQYVVSFLLQQKVTEGKKVQQVVSSYRSSVFEDKEGNLVISELPTMIAKPGKADYRGKSVQEDSNVDAKTSDEVTEFLVIFFKLYPTASEKELEYYVEDEVMRPINTSLKFVELTTPAYRKKGKAIQATFVVKYLDDITKTTQSFQYNMELQKGENWKIVDAN